MEGLKTATSNGSLNNSSSDSYNHSTVYKMVFIILSVLIVLSNATVLLLYLINPRIRSTKNLLLASLALSDLFAGMVDIPITMSCFRTGERDVCKSSAVLFRFLAFSTILHILTIIFEKYISILHPFWVVEKKHVRFVSGCVWIISSTVALLPLAWLSEDSATDPDQQRAELIYFLVTFIGFFVCPFILIVFAQVRMIRAISRSFNMVKRLESTPRSPVETLILSPPPSPAAITAQRDSIKEPGTPRASSNHNRKVLTAFALMLGTFAVCWFTWYLGVFLSYVDMENFQAFLKLVNNIPHVLVFLPSLINPLLYTYYKQDFRMALQAFLKTSLKLFCH